MICLEIVKNGFMIHMKILKNVLFQIKLTLCHREHDPGYGDSYGYGQGIYRGGNYLYYPASVYSSSRYNTGLSDSSHIYVSDFASWQAHRLFVLPLRPTSSVNRLLYTQDATTLHKKRLLRLLKKNERGNWMFIEQVLCSI